jgi:hypothetical protein
MLEEEVNQPEALEEIVEKLGLWNFESILKQPRRMFYEYNTLQSKFIKYKWLIWIGYKLGFLPKTFYVKYTKKI